MVDWLLANISTFGGEVDKIFYVIFYFTLTAFLLVTGAAIWFLVRYRSRNRYEAGCYHSNTTLEIVWTSATFVAMIILALATRPL